MIGWIVYGIARSWQQVRVTEQLTALKQSMIERGMTAEEIERVMSAGVPPADHEVKTSSHG
jgi:hypothetical protein